MASNDVCEHQNANYLRMMSERDALRAEVERLRAGIERIRDALTAHIVECGPMIDAEAPEADLTRLLAESGEQPGECPECGDVMCRCATDWTAPVPSDSTDVRERVREVIRLSKIVDPAWVSKWTFDEFDGLVEEVTDAVLAVVGQGVTVERAITIPRPVVPHGPDVREAENDWTANYLWEAARRIGASRMFGSNLTRTVSDLLAAASHAVREDKPVDDGRPAARPSGQEESDV